MSQHLRRSRSLQELRDKQIEKARLVKQHVDGLERVPFDRSNFNPAAEEKALQQVELVKSAKLYNCIDVRTTKPIKKE